MDSADRYALVLRRELRSAERLSEAAIFFGSVSLKTPCLRSSASLPCVTRCDQRLGDGFVADFLADFLAEVCCRAEPVLGGLVRPVLRVGLRAAALRERACLRRRSTMTGSFAPKNDNGPDRFPPTMREPSHLKRVALEGPCDSNFRALPVDLIRTDSNDRIGVGSSRSFPGVLQTASTGATRDGQPA